MTLEEYIIEQLEPWRKPCPRCDITAWFNDGRCAICGMDPRAQGPAPRRILVGIFT